MSTILMTAALWPIIVGFLPKSYNIPMGSTIVHGNDVKTFFCISVGLWGGCIIGFVTEYFTSFSYEPTQVPYPTACVCCGSCGLGVWVRCVG